jgi:hypothetical protein
MGSVSMGSSRPDSTVTTTAAVPGAPGLHPQRTATTPPRRSRDRWDRNYTTTGTREDALPIGTARCQGREAARTGHRRPLGGRVQDSLSELRDGGCGHSRGSRQCPHVLQIRPRQRCWVPSSRRNDVPQYPARTTAASTPLTVAENRRSPVPQSGGRSHGPPDDVAPGNPTRQFPVQRSNASVPS